MNFQAMFNVRWAQLALQNKLGCENTKVIMQVMQVTKGGDADLLKKLDYVCGILLVAKCGLASLLQ